MGYEQGLMCLTGPLLPPKISSAGGAGAWQQRGGPSLPRDSTPLSLVRETAGSSGIQTSAKRQEKGVHHCRAGKLHQINTAENKRQDNFQPARERSQKEKKKECECERVVGKAGGRKYRNVLGSHQELRSFWRSVAVLFSASATQTVFEDKPHQGWLPF